ncbi:MAG: transglycosylase SLT domain-containing protein [Aureispira sp.]|nr:transglycosylase SLT domain-containing protein [Aureispira sp.]
MNIIVKLSLSVLLTLSLSVSWATDGNPTNIPTLDDDLAELLTTQFGDLMNDFPTFTDDEYKQRLFELSGQIEYKLTSLIRERIMIRTERYRSSTEKILGLGDVYFPIFEEHLAKHGVHHHLKYLPIIESRLNPVAKSYASAVGLWQFISSTAKLYNLKITSTIDERSNTYKASDAAARLLKALYVRYQDWPLALAAYNCGGGRVNKAIKSAGGVKNYWKVKNYLPKETQKYVPYFMAVVYVGEFYHLHELTPESMPQDLVLTDTLQIKGGTPLYKLSQEWDISLDTLKLLNAGYIKNYVPNSSTSNNIIVLPARIVAKERGYEKEFNRLTSIQSENPIRRVRRISSEEEIELLMRAHRFTRDDLLYWNDLPEDYTPKPNDLVAIRKYHVPKDVILKKKAPVRVNIEGISMAALKVVGLEDQSNKALTAEVYVSLNSSNTMSSSMPAIAAVVPVSKNATSTPTYSQKDNTRVANNTVAIAAPPKATKQEVTAENQYSLNSTGALSAASKEKKAEENTDIATTLPNRNRDRRLRTNGTLTATTPNVTKNTTTVVAAVPKQSAEAKKAAEIEAARLEAQRTAAALKAKRVQAQQVALNHAKTIVANQRVIQEAKNRPIIDKDFTQEAKILLTKEAASIDSKKQAILAQELATNETKRQTELKAKQLLAQQNALEQAQALLANNQNIEHHNVTTQQRAQHKLAEQASIAESTRIMKEQNALAVANQAAAKEMAALKAKQEIARKEALASAQSMVNDIESKEAVIDHNAEIKAIATLNNQAKNQETQRLVANKAKADADRIAAQKAAELKAQKQLAQQNAIAMAEELTAKNTATKVSNTQSETVVSNWANQSANSQETQRLTAQQEAKDEAKRQATELAAKEAAAQKAKLFAAKQNAVEDGQELVAKLEAQKAAKYQQAQEKLVANTQQKAQQLAQQEETARKEEAATLAAKIEKAEANGTQLATELPSRTRTRNIRSAATTNAEPASTTTTQKEEKSLENIYSYHRIRSGETIWDVSSQYPEISTSEILELNNIKTDTPLRAGVILKIRN